MEITRRDLMKGAGLSFGLAGASLIGFDAATAEAISPQLPDVHSTLNAKIRSLVAGTKTGVYVVDDRTGVQYGYNSTWSNSTASIVKVLFVSGLLLKARSHGRFLNAEEQEIASRAIIHSDNEAATDIFNEIGGNAGIRSTAKAFGLSNTRPWVGYGWGRTLTTAHDQAKLIEALYHNRGPLTTTDRNYLWNLMGKTESDQSWGVGIVRSSSVHVNMKNGWVPLSDGYWRVNSIGHVQGAGRNYTLTILCGGLRSMSTGVNRVNAVSRSVYSILGAGVLRASLGPVVVEV